VKSLLILDLLDSVIRVARRVPLTDQVLVERETIRRLTGNLRAAVDQELAASAVSLRALVAARELQLLADQLKTAPLVRWAFVDRRRILDLCDQVRAAVPAQR
jgi:hypothetical protein